MAEDNVGAFGAVVSITIDLFTPNEPAAPGVGKMGVEVFPATSVITELFSVNAVAEL